ncbi:MAG: ParB/RepB/Spo0J family partition protein [Acidimicrobiaceae bacterium]|nr:ParB/RepB/Spo0J family partition protein [Acidimicrobiaceae bacterium]MYH00507.1 ParB/RepB/Spo0J family partition protein [Acidimicrobiaceae bacterium]MYL05000.1 ParB/RepB/Spo0J family partition protein [Acidimicrobiaceae bacterium]
MARRSGLGRGLGALIPTEPDTTESAFQDIDIVQIVPNPYQPRDRFDEESLVALAESISEVGVIQPIIVREATEGYEIIAGERRWRAAQRAGLRSIPTLVRSADDKGALEAAVVENVHRQDLNALEEAAAYRQLMDDFGLRQDEVASRVGRSRSAVANTVRLLNLAPSVQRLVVEGHLSAGHGRALLALEDEEARQGLATEIVRDNLTVRETERRVAESQSTSSEPVAAPSPGNGSSVSGEVQAGILELEELLSTRLDTRVSVKLGKRKGRITIQFSGLPDLERIYHLLM